VIGRWAAQALGHDAPSGRAGAPGRGRCGGGAPALLDWLASGSCRDRANLAQRQRPDLWRLAQDLISKAQASCSRESLERRLADGQPRRLPSIRGPAFPARDEETRVQAGRERFPRGDGRVLAPRLARRFVPGGQEPRGSTRTGSRGSPRDARRPAEGARGDHASQTGGDADDGVNEHVSAAPSPGT
jgi:hypothetical protein